MKTGRVVMFLTMVCLIALCAPLAAQEEFASGLGYINTPLAGAAPTLKFNPTQVAQLRWYNAAVNGPDLAIGGGNHPTQICSGPGYYLYITNNTTNSITVVMPQINSIAGIVGGPPAPWGIAFDGQFLWVASRTGNFVRKYSASLAAMNIVAAHNEPTAVCFDGTSIWVANFASDDITKINPVTNDKIGDYPIAGTGARNPAGLAFDGTNLWVANFGNNSVSKVRPSDGVVLKTITNVGIHPLSLAFDGSAMWVACQGDFTPANPGSVVKLNISSGAKIKTIKTGVSGPTGLAFDGVSMWVTNFAAANVVKITKDKIVGTYPTGLGPAGIAFDGARMWIGNFGSDSLSIR